MGERDVLAQENRDRIQAVENSFGPSGKPLLQPGRVLIGQGQLMKQSRRGPQPKTFFLFSDVLVYGSIILKGHWHKNQQIIPLEDIQLEDLEDGARMRNQWLIRTPRKSFYVAAASYEEKRTWMELMEECRFRLLQTGSCTPGSTFAVTWIPDQVAAHCMRCSSKFSVTQRRHHCRKCGFVVCSSCSKKRAIVRHIHPTEQVRVCSMCHPSLLRAEAKETTHHGNDTGKMGSDDDRLEGSSGEDDVAEEQVEDHDPSRWMDSQTGPCSPYFNVTLGH